MTQLGLFIAALVLAFLSFVSGKAKMGKASKFFGALSILVFIGWLASGPGFVILDWFQSPSVDVPSVDINR